MKDKEIIFGNTKEKALIKLSEFAQEINDSEDEFIIKRTQDTIETNKRKITAVFAGFSARGHKCTKAYVDWDVSLKIFEIIIKGCCFPNAYKDGEFNIEMFGDLH